MTTPRCTHELPSAADGIEKRRLKQCWNLSSTHTADRFDRDMIPQLLPFRHAAFQITWAWRAPINFLIMTQKSSRSCKKKTWKSWKGKKVVLLWCQVFLPISTDVVLVAWKFKGAQEENQFTNNEESIQESNQAARQAGLSAAYFEKEDDSNFQRCLQSKKKRC